MEAERKIFADEKSIKEKKIREHEEEINQFKINSPVAKKTQSQIAKSQQIIANSNQRNSNINQKNGDAFNLFFSVPQLFSFLWPTNNSHKLQTPVLNV